MYVPRAVQIDTTAQKVNGLSPECAGSPRTRSTIRSCCVGAVHRQSTLGAASGDPQLCVPNRCGESDGVWRKLRPFQGVDQPCTVTASVEQARKLLGKLEGPVRALSPGCAPHRPSPGCGCAIWSSPPARIRVRHGKAGERFVPLNREGRAFFVECVQDKPPSRCTPMPWPIASTSSAPYRPFGKR